MKQTWNKNREMKVSDFVDKVIQRQKTQGQTFFFLPELLWDRLPIKIPHHEVLELGWDSPVEARPGQQQFCLPLLHPVCLMAGLPLEMWVTQGHADVIQEARQRTQFDDGVLWLRDKDTGMFKHHLCRSYLNIRLLLKCHISTSTHLVPAC